MNKKQKEILSLALKLIFFIIIIVPIWTIIHESIHMLSLAIMNHKYTYHLGYFSGVSCLDCSNLSKPQYIFYVISPYIFDLIVIALLFFSRKQFLRYISFIAYLDIIGNFLLISLTQSTDFFVLIKAGFWYIALLIPILATFLAIHLNKELMIEIIKTLSPKS